MSQCFLSLTEEWKEVFGAHWGLKPALPLAKGGAGKGCYLGTFPEKTPDKGESFVRFCLPVMHQWPTDIKAEGFIEKASQGLYRRWGLTSEFPIANVQTRAIEGHWSHHAQNLRGRLLQLFKPSSGGSFPRREEAAGVDPQALQLWVLLHGRGILAGVCSAREAQSFWIGGDHTLATQGNAGGSRAWAKIIEALELLRLQGVAVPASARWLELGAAPGGITAELAQRGHQITAVDLARPSPDVLKLRSVRWIQDDAENVPMRFAAEVPFDMLSSDMNGPTLRAAALFVQGSRCLKSGGAWVYTLKIHEKAAWENDLREVKQMFTRAGLQVLGVKHLPHNRQELTLVGIR